MTYLFFLLLDCSHTVFIAVPYAILVSHGECQSEQIIIPTQEKSWIALAITGREHGRHLTEVFTRSRRTQCRYLCFAWPVLIRRDYEPEGGKEVEGVRMCNGVLFSDCARHMKPRWLLFEVFTRSRRRNEK